MPGLAFTPDNKSKSVFDMDQIRLDPKEKAMITFLDETATMAWAHYVKTGKDDKGKDVGRFFKCLGYAVTQDIDPKTGKPEVDDKGQPVFTVHDEVLKAEGKNPAKCPACTVAQPGMDQLVGMARRRFVVQVGRYNTNSQGDLIVPISLSIQAWVFGDDKFNKLADRAKVHGHDFRKKDIMLSCVSGKFQNIDIDVFPGAPEWAKTDDGKRARAILEKQKNGEIEKLICHELTYEALDAKTANATPEIGRTDSRSVVDSVDDALAGLSDTLADPLVNPAESTIPDITFDANDREPVGVAAGVVAGVEAEADFDKLLQGLE